MVLVYKCEQDYILTHSQYIGIEKQKSDGEKFNDKMKRLLFELYKLFEESHGFENNILRSLEILGYGQ